MKSKTWQRKYSFQMRLIPMNNTHHAHMFELIIGKNLSWLDTLERVYEKPMNYQLTEVYERVTFPEAGKTDRPA